MKYKNYKVYDDEDFFKKYIEKRERGNAPNETIEKPIIDELIYDVKNKDVLELGCGDGKYGKELLDRGAKSYYGIEGSKNMYQLAVKHLPTKSCKIEKEDIEKYSYPMNKYDLIIARLVFHYIENLEALFYKLKNSLKTEGKLIFSIEHPIITSCYDSYSQKGKRKNWIVDNYFESGERINTWIEKDVIKYHKTLEEYFQIIQKSNFEILTIRESKPQKKYFSDDEEYHRRMKIPLFLIFKLKK